MSEFTVFSFLCDGLAVLDTQYGKVLIYDRDDYRKAGCRLAGWMPSSLESPPTAYVFSHISSFSSDFSLDSKISIELKLKLCECDVL